jgi:hypothetical protein
LPQSLTDVTIKNLPIKPKSYKAYDGQGLYLEIYPSGSKIWRFRWSENGKEKRVGLGPWPTVCPGRRLTLF